MRKSFRGLSALVRNQLRHNPLSGRYFLFINRCNAQVKMLHLNRTDYWLWAKRLLQVTLDIVLLDRATDEAASLQRPSCPSQRRFFLP